MIDMTNSFVYMEYQSADTISGVLHNIMVFGNLPFAYTHAFIWKIAPNLAYFWESNPNFIPNGFFAFITYVILGSILFLFLTVMAAVLIEHEKNK